MRQREEMGENTKNPLKKHFRDLQRLYSTYFRIASVVSIILVGLLVVCLIPMFTAYSGIVFIICAFTVVLLFPSGLYIKFRNQNRKLKIPTFVSEKALKVFRNATFIFFIMVFAYGILVYYYGPIQPDANTFTDKVGKTYSYSEYLVYLRWQSMFITSWTLAALQGIMFFPLFNRGRRKWYSKFMT